MGLKKSLEKPLKGAYFFAVCLLLASLPFSFYMTSVSMFLLILVWVVSLPVLPIKQRLLANSEVFLFILIVLIHFIWLWNTDNFEYAFDDIRKKLPLLALPVIMASMPPFGRWKRNFLLNLFVLAMFFAGISVLLAKAGVLETISEKPRDYSVFVSHIRLSLMIVLSIFISAYFNFMTQIKYQYKILHTLAVLFNFYILFVMQAFTGLSVFMLTLVAVAPVLINRFRKKLVRRIAVFGLAGIIASVLFVIGYFVFSLYHTNKPYSDDLNIRTARGHAYVHNTSLNTLENGNKVYYFINHYEMKTIWNQRSTIDYDSLDEKGHEIRLTLIRYLTSKAEYKDAEAVERLTEDDIRAIEKGICNVRFKDGENNRSRLYYTVWQMHNYFHGGNPSGQSLTQRFEYIKTGWRIFLQHPFSGVGTGDVDDKFKHQYRMDNSPLLPEFRHRTHNQYLTFLVAFGIPGFILFLIAWFLPGYRKKAYGNYFFLVFFLIASFSMLSEDTFETLTGSAFIAGFYSLFLWGINHKTMFQEKFMRRAIELAKNNIETGNGPFGAVIVKDGKIIAETSNSVTKTNDPTAHAEVNAIRMACDKLNTFDLSGCEIYSSCEPCPMCLGAIYWAQLDKLYFASSRTDAAKAGFSDEFIYEELAKNIRERSIPTRQMMQDEAGIVFRTWDDFENKIRY